MLAYQSIHAINEALSRIKYNRYDRPWHRDEGHSRHGDELTVFTFGKQAESESKENLAMCLTMARDHGMNLLIITPSRVQVASDSHCDSAPALAKIFPKVWLDEYNKWIDSTHPIQPTIENSKYGEYFDFYTYRKSLCLFSHQGVYDVQSGQRIKNRRGIIQRMWDLGFAAYRGRPLTLAKPRWAGEREELKEITDLADRYWARRNQSDAAKKIVSVYTSINRYCAWPGAW
jgi:hypothetical protein